MSKRIHSMLPWRKVSTTELVARTKPKKKRAAPEVIETHDAVETGPTDNRLKPHAAMVTGTYIPFWKRDPRALREAETRLTYKDHPAHAANLARARAKLGLNKPARQLLLATVRKQQWLVGNKSVQR